MACKLPLGLTKHKLANCLQQALLEMANDYKATRTFWEWRDKGQGMQDMWNPNNWHKKQPSDWNIETSNWRFNNIDLHLQEEHQEYIEANQL